MPESQAETKPQAAAEQKATRTAGLEIPYNPGDVVALKITIDFELKPSSTQRTITPRSTEGGTQGDKEVGRGWVSQG